MPEVKLIAIRCQLTFGGMPTERGFDIQAADGSTYGGLADRDYCFTPEGVPIPDGVPKRGERLPGLVAAREVRTGDDGKTVLAAVPDGGALWVRRSLLIPRPSGASRVSG
jgi:hypothetical protein